MQQAVFAAMGVLALWTLSVTLLIPIRRTRAARAGRVRTDDFKFGESANVPGDVSLPNRVYMNLLEAPVLFYVACLMYVTAGRIDQAAAVIAWLYVAARLAHSLFHLTVNAVRPRAMLFGLSQVVLIAYWVWFFVPKS